MSVRLLRGDCRAILPTLTGIDVVITDPVWPNCPTGLLRGWDEPGELLREALELLPDSVRRLVIILRADSDPRFLAVVPERWPFFVAQWMPYAVPGFVGRKLGGSEIAYGFGEPIPSGPGRHLVPGMAPKAQPFSRAANGHPCSRSIAHMEWLVNWWSEPGETILDPFAGSGTVGLAADRLQRNAILIEIEEKYTEIARHRLEGDAGMFAEVMSA